MSLRQQTILMILARQGALSSRLLLKELGEKITDRTLRSDLNTLLSRHLVLKTGKARAVKWSSLMNPEESGSIRKYPEVSGNNKKTGNGQN